MELNLRKREKERREGEKGKLLQVNLLPAELWAPCWALLHTVLDLIS